MVVQGLSYSAAGGIFPDLESNLYPLHWQVNSLPELPGKPISELLSITHVLLNIIEHQNI